MVPARTWAMNAYSKDLRLRVLDAMERGMAREEASELFGVPLDHQALGEASPPGRGSRTQALHRAQKAHPLYC
jgi:transposase